MAKIKSDFERKCESNIKDHDNCETERGKGRKAITGDGRRTKEKQECM